MQKTKSKILLTIFLVILIISSYCFATDEVPETTTTGEELLTTAVESSSSSDTQAVEDATSDWANEDLYVIEDEVTVSNIVDGNAFIMGKNVTITGEIGGDVFVMAEKLTIDGGYIYSNLFAMAKEIEINGVVYDVYAMCTKFNLKENGFIYRDLRLASTDINLEGRIKRNANISCNNISFADETATVIYGNLNYSSPSQITIPEGSVAGEVKYNEVKVEEEAKASVGATIGSLILSLVQTILFTFVIALVLIWLTPKFVDRVGNTSVAKGFASFGIGFGSIIALPIIAIILLITVIGVPLVAFGIVNYIIVFSMATSITSIFIGKLIAKQFNLTGNVKLMSVILGSSAALWILGKIPVLGGLISFVSIFLGIGLTLVNIVWKKDSKKTKNTENA